MSDFGKLEARFWQRGTGKRLRGDVHAQLLAMYLMSCESARPFGLFYLPWVLLLDETGMSAKDAAGAMERLMLEEFAYYDRDEGLAWVPGMAIRRVGDELKEGDKRRPALVKEWLALPSHEFRSMADADLRARYNLPALPPPKAGRGIREPRKGLPATQEGASGVVVDNGTAPRVQQEPRKGHPPMSGIEVEVERDKEIEREGEAEEGATASPDQECALATHTPPPIRVLEDPAAVAVLERLRSHRDLAAIATPAYAERIAGLIMAGKPLSWVLGAIDELADARMAADNGPSPWNDEVLGRKLITFSKAARRPRDEPVGDMTAEQVTAEQRRRKVQVGATDWSKQADVSVETEVV